MHYFDFHNTLDKINIFLHSVTKANLLINIIIFLTDFKMSKDNSIPTSPMLYDPIPEGSVQTTKTMQFIAAAAGWYFFEFIFYL